MATDTGRPRVFLDRRDAGRALAARLRAQRLGEEGVVVGLARGGVVVAAEVASELGLALDALAVRKVGHPLEPEYGIGAVTPGGGSFLRALPDLTAAQIAAAEARARAAAEELDRRIHAGRAPVAVAGRSCLLVDDGLATGATMIAAARWARAAGAARVIVAVPVAPPETAARLAAEADAVVCVGTPEILSSVGEWYDDFRQVDDGEVVALLAAAGRPGEERLVRIEAGDASLEGDLSLPADALGIVLFAHGSGSSRHSPRNLLVARLLNEDGLATLLFDLLTPAESGDRRRVFDIPLLARRLAAARRWASAQPHLAGLPLGYFGASTGAAAALLAAADDPGVAAVVSRGGRADLAQPRLGAVTAPTLLIVGGADPAVLDLNRAAAARLGGPCRLEVIADATHLFEEPGALEQVAELAAAWFRRHFGP